MLKDMFQKYFQPMKNPCSVS